jgi:hypothetical protein
MLQLSSNVSLYFIPFCVPSQQSKKNEHQYHQHVSQILHIGNNRNLLLKRRIREQQVTFGGEYRSREKPFLPVNSALTILVIKASKGPVRPSNPTSFRLSVLICLHLREFSGSADFRQKKIKVERLLRISEL